VATAAERDGVAVVVANGRGTIGDAPIGEADLLQTLAAASRIIPVDATRVYLYGVCEGGRRALLLAEHYPQLFAGVGVYGPVLTPYKQDDASTPWFDRRSVLTLAPNLSNIPVILAWGDLDPEMSPLLAYRFADVLHRSGGTVTPLIIRGGMHKQENLEQSIFPMLVTYTRPTVPYHVHLLVAEPLYTKAYWLSAHSSRYEVGSVDAELNGERVVVKTTGVSSLTLHLNTLAGAPTPTVVLWNGRLFTLHGEPSSSLRLDGAKPALPPPLVASAFASKFLVVRSTRTSGEYLAERAFSQRWKRDFFTPFTSVNDIRVTTPMLARANLIFIGEPKRGTLAESLVHRAFPKLVPLLHTSDAERLVVIRATYNPLHKAGIVVFVHAPPSHWTTKAMDLAIGGRYNDEH
jgi:hypothetical protein